MYQLLIVDDEPLVQIGLCSMLKWEDYGVTVCGSASNGRQAMDFIRSKKPDLVITDIKMPVMNGLELMEACQKELDNPPEFIILTCYEDFPYIKKALECQAADYVIKLGLKPQELAVSVERALKKLRSKTSSLRPLPAADPNAMLNYKDKFLLKLLHNLFESTSQFNLQARELGLSFDSGCYAAANCIIAECTTFSVGSGQYITLYHNTISMLANMLEKYLTFHLVSLDMKQFCILFEFDESSPYKEAEEFSKLLKETFQMIYNYYQVTVFCAVGSYKNEIRLIADSHQEARQILPLCTKEAPVLLYPDQVTDSLPSFKNTFNITVLKEDIRKAFEEYDMASFQHITGSITALFRAHPSCYVQAMDVTSNILHLCLTLVPESEPFLAEKFSQFHDSYRSLYCQKNTEQLMDWLELFSQAVAEFYQTQYKELKNTLVRNIMQYVENNITEKLVLNDVANLFSISPNYLGHLFKKNTSLGFNEYVTKAKISKAKYMMFHTDLKIYEIATQLGFENSFYFSRVFKKVEGCSPRQYLQSQQKN